MSKIVIADDSEAIRELVARQLRLLGHEVQAATNGREAVELVKEQHPDLVILDVHMPELDGFDACRAIRAHDPVAHTPVVALTSLEGMFADAEAKAAGFTSVMYKPFPPEELNHKVTELLGG